MPRDLSPHLQPLLDRFIVSGAECGLQVAVYHRGELILNAVAGIANRETRALVTPETLFPVFSVTKGMAATVIHRLAERGLLDYDEPLARHWPEFATHGKQGITLRQALSHMAGLPQMPEDVAIEDLGNWEFMCTKIAALAPLWPPGSQVEYHPITYAWLIGEVARRVTGKTFHQLFEEEVRLPLGGGNLYIGLPKEVDKLIATLEDDPNVLPVPIVPPKGTPEPVPARFGSLASLMNRADSHATCVPATSGLFSALESARHYAALLDYTLLSAKQLTLAIEPQLPSISMDDYPLDRALGYRLGKSPVGTIHFGHGGHGGSTAFADPTHQLAIAIHKNRLNRGEETLEILSEIYRLLGLN